MYSSVCKYTEIIIDKKKTLRVAALAYSIDSLESLTYGEKRIIA